MQLKTKKRKKKTEAASDVPHWGWFRVPVHSSVHPLFWKKEEGENLPERDMNGHPHTKSSKLSTGSQTWWHPGTELRKFLVPGSHPTPGNVMSSQG